jgi:hypothetical protein
MYRVAREEDMPNKPSSDASLGIARSSNMANRLSGEDGGGGGVQFSCLTAPAACLRKRPGTKEEVPSTPTSTAQLLAARVKESNSL